MKALTICQPYAHLIVRGDKLVENREWFTSYRGPLLIHAGKSREWMDDEDEAEFEAGGDPLIFGAVVGRAHLIACLHIDRIERGDYHESHPWLSGHAHTNGTYCWVLENVQRFKTPIPFKGAQGLWEFPDALLMEAA